MPRSIRKLSETKTYHVMIRGNERKNIFIDDENKRKFIDLLCKIKGYSPEGDRISSREHPLSLGNEVKDFSIYAYYFNKRYGRIGHLFQDRFKSEELKMMPNFSQ